MGDVNFYQILGVGRSATADQIKSAHRNLVKRHHPDLFSTAADKAKATEKLSSINEAYAVLGNPERRRRYDEQFAHTAQMRARAAATASRQSTVRPGRNQTKSPRTRITPKMRFRFSKKRAGFFLAAITGLLVLVYSSTSEPKLTVKWSLWEKLEVLPLRGPVSMPPGRGWVRLSQYVSVAGCSAALRQIVQEDKRAGGSAVFDEKNGTMAITMQIAKEVGRTQTAGEANGYDSSETPGTPENQPPSLGETTTKRVRNLECRATQRLDTDSWLRRTLRSIGLS